jgi:anaerobic nitric oxide reductase flavorubredoxin
MKPVKVVDGVHWVGAVDWNVRMFHGHHYYTHRGTTYNAYLVMDEKTALVDTVYHPFVDELVARIRAVMDPAEIDYVIANHGEPDHSGGIPRVMELAKNAQLVCTQKGAYSIQKQFHGEWGPQIVKTGDEISLGQKTLQFVEAPMLHWPDSMFTYIPEQALLLPNDAFGQHIATAKRFDDENNEQNVMEEATKYFAAILTPFSKLILKKLAAVEQLGLDIKIIAPSHGIIWRTNPNKILAAYLRWAQGVTEEKVLILYETMWNSTKKMARAIIEGIISEGVEAKLFNLAVDDRTTILGELLEAKAVAIGSATINKGVLPHVPPILEEIHGLKFQNKIGAAFGSYGWGGGAVKQIEQALQAANIELVLPSLRIRYAPDSQELNDCVEFGRQLAHKVKEH